MGHRKVTLIDVYKGEKKKKSFVLCFLEWWFYQQANGQKKPAYRTPLCRQLV